MMEAGWQWIFSLNLGSKQRNRWHKTAWTFCNPRIQESAKSRPSDMDNQSPLHVCVNDNDCHSSAKCQNRACICQGNTTGNGKNCRDSDPCTKYCGPGGTCLKEKLMPKHDAVCRCNKGFNKTNKGMCIECSTDEECSYGTCSPEGECKCKARLVKEGRICKRAPLHPCKKKEDCHENAGCHQGKCHCLKTTVGNGKYCEESKPCPKEHEEKCEAGGNRVISCVVDPLFPDQPECKCHLGFKTSEAGICVDITECEKVGLVCPPGKVCKGQKDSNYTCACKEGFEEIVLENGNSTCQAGANEICQGGVCKCALGFARNNDMECKDVDECRQDETPCKVNEECSNEQGSYSCYCRLGYRKENKVCVKKGECTGKCKQHEVCLEGKCQCKEGYKKTLKGYCVLRRKHLEHLDESLGLSLHSKGFPTTLFLCVLLHLAFTD